MIWLVLFLVYCVASFVFMVYSLKAAYLEDKWWHWPLGLPSAIIMIVTFFIIEVMQRR